MIRWLLLIPVVACDGPSLGPTGDGPFVDDTPVDTDGGNDDTVPDTDDDTNDTDALEGPGPYGLLLDPAGEPLGDFDLLCCMAVTCYRSETEQDGSFYFRIEPGQTGGTTRVALKTHEELFETPLRWAAALVPGNIVDGVSGIDVGNVYIPDLPTGVPIGDADEDPQVMDIGDGLELTLNRGDLTPDLGVFLYDLASRRIPDPYVPDYPDLDGDTVQAVYAIHPFATKSSTPVAIKAPSTLPAGTLVHFRAVSHLTGVFEPVATGHSDGSFVTTDPGQGILLLTHLVISTD